MNRRVLVGDDAQTRELADIKRAIALLEREIRTSALVAGQFAVEGPHDTAAILAEAEADRALGWADRLWALIK